MERSESPLLPIKYSDITALREEMTPYIRTASWKPDQPSVGNEQIDLGFLMQSKALGVHEADSTSLMKEAVRISQDRMLLSTSVCHAVNSVRDGLCLGRHVANLYEKSSGLETLLQRNKDGALHQSELPEFHDKLETQSAILLFVASHYILWKLHDYRSEEVASINIDFGGIPEIKLTRPSSAVNCSMYYYGAYLERSGIVNTELEFLKLTELYFERLGDEILMRKDSLNYSDFFSDVHYKLEHSSFLIQGWETHLSQATHSISFNRIQMSDIVANREAKHMFRRFAERLLCYDVHTGKNPMLELGGLPAVTMGDGKPGTGKSMLIAATATFLHDMCEHIGVPFLFWPLPENIISTFQGGSAERAVEWFKPMQDASRIIFAPIDDAENNLEERTRQGVSAGVREFIGVFLRNTEGAYAINRGNRMISLFTNIPDQIDKAVLSRIQYRVAIDGAENAIDFVDQDHIWWRKFDELMPDFVDLNDVSGYEYMSSQKELKSISEVYAGEYEFRNEQVQEIYNRVKGEHDPDGHAFFGHFYEQIQDQFSFFTSRDLRNIQKAVDARLIDFDLPQEWLDDPTIFFHQDYEEKLGMLKDLVKSNLGGMSFAQVRMREAFNYIETAVRINTQGIERQIQEAAERIYVQQQATKRLAEGKIDIGS